MSLILGIDTSSSSGSVALLKNGLLVGSQLYSIEKSHSSLLHVMIEQMMGNAGCKMNELSAVAVAEGPGSYTGLRIGVSAAKGLCLALDIPLIAVNTLEAMAYQMYRRSTDDVVYCPMLDARRMEVYSALFDKDFNTIKPTAPVILEDYAYEDILNSQKVLFFGDGSDKSKEVITHQNAYFVDHIVPSAEEVALLAFKKYKTESFENVISFEPFYLKEFRTASSFK
ncbi:MAG: tRNA (adenosine(37)-N6)-threonylcarbamoyltransferase complex dimerization subunit type 1 TsaB [Reichenbachiella sp.]|uniref:tRNA (adenosine(37)-N6)-threonylcarbamoyltransferase complex dimerization subunit type 1 TsaB n=1 Tax=Reichenbachiella sp. TaxID=2184521 RepID=UPI0029674A70|nr:tRNA (adenosine(37)-N6)-threonylcarbamoyltransferase complex dimerization subunit type 1 TsaB [Reichenbachiella sp.]MDW3211961.1 tRNA (adenosine(37)-N6)-threonylcarbamoyltransferase complex dimerization subunit type 1 TsaB [Reichenbachiella sp.]